MRRPLPLLLASLSLAFAPTPPDRPPSPAVEAEYKALMGGWELVSRSDGAEVKNARAGELVKGFYRSRCGECSNGKACRELRITLDPKKDPKRMVVQGRTPRTCYYRLEGDTLTVCDPEEGHPPSFKPCAGVTIHVFRRLKEGEPRLPPPDVFGIP